MNKEIILKLCEKAKQECKITWNDEDTDEKVKRTVEDAVIALHQKLGMKDETEEVFLEPGLTRSLFLKYCLYDWNNMVNEFEKNYIREILTERHRYEVKYERQKNQQLQ